MTQEQPRTLDDLLAQRPSEYLTAQEKQELVDTGKPFMVANVNGPLPGTFGKRWEVNLIIDGVERMLTLPDQDSRRELMMGLRDFCREQGPQGPVILRTVPTKYPNPFYFFAKPAAEQQTLISDEQGR